jgi:hypothetical protein
MKAIKLTACALVGVLLLTINAASAEEAFTGSAGTKFTSDYNRRGELLSAEALQAQVGFNTSALGVDVFGDFFTNQSTDSEVDTNEVTVGISTPLFEDSFNAYLGVYNTDTDNTDNSLEAFVSLQANVLLSPTVSLYRDTDDALYTFEGQLSYDVDFDLANLNLAGVYGNTDTSVTQDRTYYGAKVTATKSLKDNIDIYTDIALTDTSDRGNETVWGVGLNVSF